MSHWLILAGCFTVLSGRAAETASPGRGETGRASVELYRHADVVTVFGLEKPPSDPKHTYILTHGLGGIEERFFELGRLILSLEPGAVVLVIEWDPAQKERLGDFGNPWAAAKRIDPTGDALGAALADLHKKKIIDARKTTFIGESFGNYVNHRAAVALGKAGCGKAYGALVLNPASELGGYEPPLLTETYHHSVAFISDSLFDTQQSIGRQTVRLTTTCKDPFVQHTFGMRWLRSRILAGERVHTHFQIDAKFAAVNAKK